MLFQASNPPMTTKKATFLPQLGFMATCEWLTINPQAETEPKMVFNWGQDKYN